MLDLHADPGFLEMGAGEWVQLVGGGEDIPQGTPHIPRCLETFTIGFVFVRSLKQGVATL